jgi:hypothetical protein
MKSSMKVSKSVDEIIAAAGDNRSEVKIGEGCRAGRKGLADCRGAYYPS